MKGSLGSSETTLTDLQWVIMECRNVAHVDGIDVSYEQRSWGWPVLMLHGGYLDHRHMMNEMEPVFFDRAGWHRLYPDLPADGSCVTIGPRSEASGSGGEA
jgi:hypothetical protein